MKNMTRAQRKKMMRQIKVGDVVTWGEAIIAHRVIATSMRGVVVDASSRGFPNYPVAWDGNARHGTCHAEGGKGPVWKVNSTPDVRLR